MKIETKFDIGDHVWGLFFLQRYGDKCKDCGRKRYLGMDLIIKEFTVAGIEYKIEVNCHERMNRDFVKKAGKNNYGVSYIPLKSDNMDTFYFTIYRTPENLAKSFFQNAT